MEHNSDQLISNLTFLLDKGEHSVALGYLLGNNNQTSIAIEPIITSLKSVDKTNILFKFDGNKTLTLSASDKEFSVSFKLDF